jgi:hypothetical protein
MSSYIDSSCCSCRDHHLEKASAKDSPLGTMASTQTLPLTTSLTKISIPSRLFSSHQIRMPHQNVLATGHLDPGWHWSYKKTLPLPTLTLLPSFCISSRQNPSTGNWSFYSWWEQQQQQTSRWWRLETCCWSSWFKGSAACEAKLSVR